MSSALFSEKLASCVDGGHALQNSAKSRKKSQSGLFGAVTTAR
jgi:hypothetical protein